MNRYPPPISVASHGRHSMVATLSYLLLRLVLGVAVLAHPFPAASQSAAVNPQNSAASSDNAAISGTVRDQAGTALRGVRVTLGDERSSAQRTVLTTENGAYVFTPVEAGTYTLAAELSGFQNAVRPHLTVTPHQRLNVEFSLAPKPSGSGRQMGNAQATSRSNGAGSEQTFRHFDYDDKPDYKPGEVGSSSESGGYSSGANADSYDLILAYVESERPREHSEAEDSDKAEDRRGAGESRAPEHGQRSKIDEATLQAWNENQFFSRGSDLLLHREFAPANELFQRGVAHFPDSAKLQMGLGIALYARGLYDQAVSVLVHATDLAPSDPRPYLLLARAYSVSHSQNDEVVKRLERLVELDTNSALARYYYALSLRRSSGEKPGVNAAQIEHLLKEAVALDPQFADAHLELGALYAEQAKYSDAIPEYRRAIGLNPDLAAAHYRLAQVYARTGDAAAAQSELDLYQRLQHKKPAGTRSQEQ